MEKNNNNKRKGSIFKKEGFYIILFVCLCLVATIAAVTTNKNLAADKGKVQSETAELMDEKKDLIGMDTSEDEFYDNALQVQEENDSATALKEDDSDKSDNTNNEAAVVSAPVANTSNQTFVKPIEGEVGREYSTVPVFWNTTDSNRPNFGLDIISELGGEVVACLDGTVKEVSTETMDGVTVTVYHPQVGLRTVYANLDSNLNVKVGDQVKQGDEIGTIGATTIRASYESYGNKFLHFEVIKGETTLAQHDSVDPLKYVKY